MIKIFFEDRCKNFGDWLNPYLVEMLSGDKVEALPYHRIMEADIICCGSILDAVPDKYSGYIWGTGFMWVHTTKTFPNAKILAVRGPHTAIRIMRSFDDIGLGDPGIIISLMDRFKNIPKKYELGIVPHYVDVKDERVKSIIKGGAEFIDVLDEVEKVIYKIGQCKKIISSSLHGLIIADALGVPNVHKHFTNKVAGNGFKFMDYKGMSAETIKHRAKYLIDVFPFKGGNEWRSLS